MTSEHLRWCHLSKCEYVTLTERNSARKTGPQTFSNVVVPPAGQREHRRARSLRCRGHWRRRRKKAGGQPRGLGSKAPQARPPAATPGALNAKAGRRERPRRHQPDGHKPGPASLDGTSTHPSPRPGPAGADRPRTTLCPKQTRGQRQEAGRPVRRGLSPGCPRHHPQPPASPRQRS